MKIKSINNFTLTECQEYLDTNPNSEFAQEVVQRMEYLKQLKVTKSQQDNARRINEFNTKFNRHCATQRYEEAFAVCLEYINNVDDKTIVFEKAKTIIHKLKHRIQLPASVSISYDWLIDQLVLNGYDKMKYDGNSLSWQCSRVIIKTNTKISEILSKCRINLAIRIICIPILLFLGYCIWCFIFFNIGGGLLSGLDYHEYLDSDIAISWGIVSTICVAIYLFWGINTYAKTFKEPKLLLRRIANIIIENLVK